jgi:hypothetical protein
VLDRFSSPVAGRDRLSERRLPGRRLEGVGEVLGLVRYQSPVKSMMLTASVGTPS